MPFARLNDRPRMYAHTRAYVWALATCAAALAVLAVGTDRSHAATTTIGPSADRTANSSFYRQLAGCSTTTTDIWSILNEDIDAALDTNCAAGTAAHWARINSVGRNSSKEQSYDLADVPAQVELATSVQLRIRGRVVSDPRPQKRDLYVTLHTSDGTQVASHAFTSVNGTMNTSSSAALTGLGLLRADLDGLYVTVAGRTVDSGGSDTTSYAVSTVNLDIVYNLPPAAPTHVAPVDGATAQPSSVTLQIGGFSDPDGDLHGSTQWQVRAVGGSWTTPDWDSGAVAGAPTSIATPAMADNDYEFRARVSDAPGSWGPWSTETTYEVGPPPPPAVTPLVAITPTNAAPALSWTTVAGASYYRVYRGAADCTGLTQVNVDGATTGGTWTDAAAVADATYCYTVQPVGAGGREQLVGNATTVVVFDQSPPPAVTTLAGTTPTTAQPALTWTTVVDTGGSGTAYYRVLRAPTCVGPFVQVSVNGAPTSGSWTDAGATAGSSYCYEVRAVDAAGNAQVTGNSRATVDFQTGVFLDATGCQATAAFDFGSIAAGSGRVTSADCRIEFGAIGADARLVTYLQDGAAPAMVGVPDYASGTADWTNGTGAFGACRRATTATMNVAEDWNVDANAGADCADGNADPWYPIPTAAGASGAIVARSAAGELGASVDMRFGLRVPAALPSGTHSAVVVFEAVSPAL